MNRLQTIDADTLQAPLTNRSPSWSTICCPRGWHLLAGAPKTSGKSWLAVIAKPTTGWWNCS